MRAWWLHTLYRVYNASFRLTSDCPTPGTRAVRPHFRFVTNGCLSHRLLKNVFQGRRAPCARRLPMRGNLHNCVWATIGGRCGLTQRGAMLAHADSCVRQLSPCLKELPYWAKLAQRLLVPARLPVSEGALTQCWQTFSQNVEPLPICLLHNVSARCLLAKAAGKGALMLS